MELVNKYNHLQQKSTSYSLFKEAEKYCSEKDLVTRFEETAMHITYQDLIISTNDESCIVTLSKVLKDINEKRNLQSVFSCTWQGNIIKDIIEDKLKINKNFEWLSTWRSCPTSTISEIMLLLYQTLDTRCYRKHIDSTITITTCRLCLNGQESVKHLLSNCSDLAKSAYIKRHNNALKCFFFELLKKFNLIEEVPPWFSNIDVKPSYTNEVYSAFWNIPEFSGRDGESGRNCATPDGKIIMKNEKKSTLSK